MIEVKNYSVSVRRTFFWIPFGECAKGEVSLEAGGIEKGIEIGKLPLLGLSEVWHPKLALGVREEGRIEVAGVRSRLPNSSRVKPFTSEKYLIEQVDGSFVGFVGMICGGLRVNVKEKS